MREQDAAGDAATDPVSLARAALAAARAAAREAANGSRTGFGSAAGSRSAAASDRSPNSAPDPATDQSESTGSRTRTGAAAGSAGIRRPARPRGPARRPGFAFQPPVSDPQPLAAAIGGLLDEEGWTLAAATGSVFGRWAQIVGGDLAAHTKPEKLADGELTVAADSTAWATQLRLLSGQLIKRLNAELGDQSVLRVRVVGPVTGARQPGQWRVRGGRGPRDTYG
jgi:predicted nucleic acid-binding Zn ribbon protein